MKMAVATHTLRKRVAIFDTVGIGRRDRGKETRARAVDRIVDVQGRGRHTGGDLKWPELLAGRRTLEVVRCLEERRVRLWAHLIDDQHAVG